MNKPDEIWVPVGTPDHLNIPYFAMGVPEAKKVLLRRLPEGVSKPVAFEINGV